MKKLLAALVIAILLVPAVGAKDNADTSKAGNSPTAVDTTKITWHSYDEGLVLARETDRPIMINFTTKWCGYCKKMQRTTFKDP